MPISRREILLWRKKVLFAGIDEVGRGSIAGPVVAAAVILKPWTKIKGICDSKALSYHQRLNFLEKIKEQAIGFGIGAVNHRTIDRINIRNATFLAMKKALSRLKPKPEFVLVDGFPIPDLPIRQKAIIKGDKKNISIACASIIAKVSRDKMMERFANFYSNYGFQKNRGYPTKEHKSALSQFGPCPIHRLTFAPVKSLVKK